VNINTELINQYQDAVNIVQEWRGDYESKRKAVAKQHSIKNLSNGDACEYRNADVSAAGRLCGLLKSHVETCAVADGIKKSVIAILNNGTWAIQVENISELPDAGYWHSPILILVTEAGQFLSSQVSMQNDKPYQLRLFKDAA
jgi:hypothetical protein